MIDLSKSYNEDNFKSYLVKFLPEDFIYNKTDIKLKDDHKFFKTAYQLGTVESLDNLVVIQIERIKAEKSRSSITKELFKFLENIGYAKALIITFSKDETHYRLSYIKSDLDGVSETRVKRKFGNPKRLSFLLGEDQRIHTPTKQLIKLGKIKNLADLFSRFNIEIVNDEFFENYKKLFINLQNKIEKDSIFNKFLKDKNITSDFFSKRLLGQIVFCYFLQKKKWLGVKSDKKFGTGDSNYLRNQFNIYEDKKNNFFNEFLEYFFYEGLNKLNDNNFVKGINVKVPYIGGGLFEYYDGYDWKKEKLNIPNSFFSNTDKNGILDIFELYNFTVDENDDFDVELAVDPEMLGRVFENLLPENIRKSGGSYYTPRSIVNYMCETSLTKHIFNELKNKIDLKVLENFVKNKNFEINKNLEIKKYANELDIILISIKFCDPAIGSGAFAVAFVNLVSSLRNILKDYVNRKYKNSLYYFKRDCIQNSIYGVDIDYSAVEIAKLRLWLSLIVNEEDYDKTEPLPNLDFQIMQGNSLINEIDGYDFRHIDIQKQGDQFELLPNDLWETFSKTKEEFINLKKKYFNTKSYSKKVDYRREIEKILIKLSNQSLRLGDANNSENAFNYDSFKKIREKKNYFLWNLYFIEIFQDKAGFDIIIANPPYIKERDNKDKFAEISKTKWGAKHHQGKMDFWFFFLHLSIDLLKENGIINFITSKYWLNSSGAKKLINRIENNLKFSDVVDIGSLKVFQNVAGHHMIHMYEKNKSLNYEFNYKKIENDLSSLKNINNEAISEQKIKNSSEIFQEDEINFRENKVIIENYEKLDNVVFSSQGLVQNPDKINKKNSIEYDLRKGDGVFVINDIELNSLKLTKEERKFAKPFYDEKDINNLSLDKKTDQNVLYITSKNCNSISQYKNLEKHLNKFKLIMNNRRENISGKLKYFQLHWPRNEEFFLKEKIIIPSMGKRFNLALCDFPAYFGIGSNILIQKKESFPIKFIFCLLSSSFARYWFELNSKERGAGFDFTLKKIKNFPIKKNEKTSEFLDNFKTNFNKIEKFRKINDELVYDLYEINHNLRSEISKFSNLF